MLKAESSLPDGKGVAIEGWIGTENHRRCLRIEPCEQKGYHSMILIDWGSGEEANDAYMEFTKRGLADAYLDIALKINQWTPIGCAWEWSTEIIDRLENPYCTPANKALLMRSWGKEKQKQLAC